MPNRLKIDKNKAVSDVEDAVNRLYRHTGVLTAYNNNRILYDGWTRSIFLFGATFSATSSSGVTTFSVSGLGIGSDTSVSSLQVILVIGSTSLSSSQEGRVRTMNPHTAKHIGLSGYSILVFPSYCGTPFNSFANSYITSCSVSSGGDDLEFKVTPYPSGTTAISYGLFQEKDGLVSLYSGSQTLSGNSYSVSDIKAVGVFFRE